MNARFASALRTAMTTHHAGHHVACHQPDAGEAGDGADHHVRPTPRGVVDVDQEPVGTDEVVAVVSQRHEALHELEYADQDEHDTAEDDPAGPAGGLLRALV